jgi:3-hydroxybutyryl-CoA dehydrogenase
MRIERVAIVGAGTMGGGIAIGCLAAGLPTTLVDMSDAALEAAGRRIDDFFRRAVAKGRLEADAGEAALARFEAAGDPAAVAGADLVIEAVFEDLGLKQALFGSLAPHLAPEAVVATNTSALRVADLAGSVPHPERFIGLHYFSPAEINPLVEAVQGPATASATVERALDFVGRTGKTALICRDAPGFVVNRFFCPYSNEAVRCLEDGLGQPAAIDRVACETFGLALGPFAVMNIIKPRINLHAIRNLAPLGGFYQPAAALVRVGEAGEIWPLDGDDPSTPAADEEAVSARLRAALFLPVLEAIGEDVAEPAAFDTGARLALRFGTPPVAMMRDLGRARVVALLEPLVARHGAGMPDKGLSVLFPA